MHTLIVFAVIIAVLILVFAVVRYASKPPSDVNHWERTNPADRADYGYDHPRGVGR
ncbi:MULTISPECIES: hypothetical protein [Nocardia]|uniref:Uncharacterized protein n=1 Tax=Nocardia aurea TaxID=2144174 RepID=A0ABV3FLT5_9NOCA|nr:MULTISPECIES: hypothetical protein [Nocardia]